jgi:hypothetical protein
LWTSTVQFFAGLFSAFLGLFGFRRRHIT